MKTSLQSHQPVHSVCSVCGKNRICRIFDPELNKKELGTCGLICPDCVQSIGLADVELNRKEAGMCRPGN